MYTHTYIPTSTPTYILYILMQYTYDTHVIYIRMIHTYIDIYTHK